MNNGGGEGANETETTKKEIRAQMFVSFNSAKITVASVEISYRSLVLHMLL